VDITVYRGFCVVWKIVIRDFDVLCRPGGDLLSRVLRQSTIGAEGFNGRVRNGIGFRPLAMTTRPAKHIDPRALALLWGEALGLRIDFEEAVSFRPIAGRVVDGARLATGMINESVQAERVISTGKLHALPHFHTRPINVVVYHDSSGKTRFEVGFPLRCFQRLSRPYVATLQCGWRHNRSTRGTSIPVLSY
jgi:hypothetical protein